MKTTIEELKKLTRENPTNEAAWLKLGDAYLKMGDTQKSIEAQIEAVKLYETSNPTKAIQLLRLILSMAPTRVDCQERLARLQGGQ
jgi:DNA-binding SARP family transcriptional activator